MEETACVRLPGLSRARICAPITRTMNPIDNRLPRPPPAEPASKTQGFRLLRYFSMAALMSFLMVGAVLYLLERRELAFFGDVQQAQTTLFKEAQAELSTETEQAARKSLVAAQETANVNLTRAFANSLWDSHFGPMVAKIQSFPIQHCRAIADNPNLPKTASSDARQECFAEIGLRIRALPGFVELDRRAIDAMRGSNVFKIKVYDLRGLTVYSSDHRNIGEDKLANAGWRMASLGKPASELTHRDHFSTFEGVVENRDLISSYIPVRRNGSQEVVGVFEIYADVTPLLEQIKTSSAQLARLVAANQGKIEQTAKRNVELVAGNSVDLLRVVGALFVVLFAVLLYIVRRGQTIIDRQILAQEKSAAEERMWHQEKMTAMAALAANVSHETGNALTVIGALAQELASRNEDDPAAAETADQIQEQSRRVFRMTRQISAFAMVSDRPEYLNVNSVIEAVCYFFSFDRRFSSPIEFRPGESLPWCDLVPDYLKEVLMNLLPSLSGRIVVETAPCSKGVRLRIRAEPPGDAPNGRAGDALSASRMEIVSRRIEEMGGTLAIGEAGRLIEIELPAVMREDSPH